MLPRVPRDSVLSAGESWLITARERHFEQLGLVNERTNERTLATILSFLQKPPREHFGVFVFFWFFFKAKGGEK